MSFLSGITQVTAALQAARDVILALKRPIRPKPAIPATESARAGAEAKRARFLDELNKANARFVALRDVDGNGTLSPGEVELNPEAFAQLDRNGDGELTVRELNEACLAKSKGLKNMLVKL